jgi:hypothetical protein
MQFGLLALQARLQKFSHIQIVLDTPFAFAVLGLLPYRQRLSRVAEGTGPTTPQQSDTCTKVPIPAQWGEIRSSTDQNPG